MRLILIIFSIAILLPSCGKQNVQEQIEDYISDNNLDAQSTADGIYYVIEEPGSDEMPDLTNTVTIDYRGTLLNGNQFDSSYDRGEASMFYLGGNLIRGWKIGIPLFGKGGKGKLIIPPSLGYGSSANGSIPGSSVLVFDIDLIDFE